MTDLVQNLRHESVWLKQATYEQAESRHFGGGSGGNDEVIALRKLVVCLEKRVAALEKHCGMSCAGSRKTSECKSSCKKPATVDEDAPLDDDFELFGDDEVATAKEAKPAALVPKGGKKKKVAKSNIQLDVKPWDDTTDMAELEKHVRAIEQDGLLWGASKIVPIAYGVKKLTVTCVVEDEKVSVDDLQEKIEALEDFVQSTDIVSFNKV